MSKTMQPAKRQGGTSSAVIGASQLPLMLGGGVLTTHNIKTMQPAPKGSGVMAPAPRG